MKLLNIILYKKMEQNLQDISEAGYNFMVSAQQDGLDFMVIN